ncbi:MgtC/SapB family protein [Methylobacter psychrophilus]|uniref:MgtC/SapB family protein n=1 Tax=Methylobacter psychrophilus TaxID=96941 RepID=UPI0021D491A1|nr:MgtC/SapB family protein [Methylobacter psychrophilus]
MEAINNINIQSLLDTFISLSTAFILGAAIGLERQFRQRTAGLRTNVLVAVGAAVFVDMANRLTGHEGAVHVAAYVVSGIGFLGAGVIMKGDGNIRGLNTAATLWGAAAVGACAGADLISEAVLAALFVLAGNTLLRPVVNAINRKPIDDENSEVTYSVCVICDRQHQKDTRDQLKLLLEAANYPVSDFDVHPFVQNEVQIFAILLSTSIDSEDLNRVVDQLMTLSSVSQAYWSPSTID